MLTPTSFFTNRPVSNEPIRDVSALLQQEALVYEAPQASHDERARPS